MQHNLVLAEEAGMRQWLAGIAAEACPEARPLVVDALTTARRHAAAGHCCHLVLVGDGPAGFTAAVSELVTLLPHAWVVVVARDDAEHRLVAGLRAGAHGYLLREQTREQLVRALAAAAHGEPPLAPSVARHILRLFQRGMVRTDPSSHPTPCLSRREREVLSLLCRGFNRNDIGLALGITANTAAGYIKEIYRKLGVSGRAEATLAAVEMGLIAPGVAA
ncbi:LuxR C-terminal-related transcriptional regulator [Thiohalospira sp.]|uniref:helix-turn-helix transcriptional regulator n=1 Tax=Thiohalospira sp. TaxID=3080549 RepID=UPI00397F3EB1